MTIEATLAAALSEQDDDRWSELMQAAVAHGAEAALEQVVRLMGSEDPAEQALGADLAGMLPASEPGWEERAAKILGYVPSPRPEFDARQLAVVAALLRETLETTSSDLVAESAALAASKLSLQELAPAVAAHAADDDADVREAVAYALSSLSLPQPAEQVEILVALAHDPVTEVRSWALFALCTGVEEWMVPADTPAAIAAYRANVEDPEDEVRMEAERALALLGDVEMLTRVFETHAIVEREAIERARDLRDTRLHEPLTLLRDSLDDEEEARSTPEDYVELVDEAVAACAPTA